MPASALKQTRDGYSDSGEAKYQLMTQWSGD